MRSPPSATFAVGRPLRERTRWSKASQDEPRTALAGERGSRGARGEARGSEGGIQGALPPHK